MTNKTYTLTITADARTFYAIEGALYQAQDYYSNHLDDKLRAELYADLPPDMQPKEMSDDRRRMYEDQHAALGVALEHVDAFLKANDIDEIRE